MNPPLKFVPSEIEAIRLACPHCSCHFRPDWLASVPGPMGSYPAKGGGTWVRLTAPVRCVRCGGVVQIPLPVVPKRDEVLLFGDEASRRITEHSGILYTYSLVGASRVFLPAIEEAITTLKSELAPGFSPDEWALHLKVIWSGQQRQKHPVFRTWDRAKVASLLPSIGGILQAFGDRIYRSNIMLAGEPVGIEAEERFSEYVRNEAYIIMVANVINEVTRHGAEPIIHFDAEKPVEAGSVIQNWARQAFRGGQSNLLYCFLSHSIHVREPVFVKPASHRLLEIADALSFAVARYHFCRFGSKVPDVDLACFGPVHYMTFRAGGNMLLTEVSRGYPWHIGKEL